MECKKLFQDIKSEKLNVLVSGLVLAEIGWVLGSYYKTPRNIVAKKIEGILKFKGIKTVDSYDWLSAMRVYGTKSVKLVDAVLATVPKVAAKEWTIVSYDEDFKKLPVLWKKPSQL